MGNTRPCQPEPHPDQPPRPTAIHFATSCSSGAAAARDTVHTSEGRQPGGGPTRKGTQRQQAGPAPAPTYCAQLAHAPLAPPAKLQRTRVRVKSNMHVDPRVSEVSESCGKLARRTSRRITRRNRRAPELSNKLSKSCSGSPDLAQIQPISDDDLLELGRIRQTLANFDPSWPKTGPTCPVVGQTRPKLVKQLPKPGQRVAPTCGQNWHTNWPESVQSGQG